MCRYCVKYGDGTKWYLNPKNYSNEIRNSELTKFKLEELMLGQLLGLKGTIQEIGTTAQRFKYDAGFGEYIDLVFQDLHDDMARAIREELPYTADRAEAGQVIPIEDAEKIIDLSGGDVLMYPCFCRKYYGGIDKMCCTILRPGGKELLKNVPWDSPNKMVSQKEAKKILREFDKEGIYHAIFWAPAPIPFVICNCEYPYCIALRLRFHYNTVDTCRKGEYIALVDSNKCTGCGGAPSCQNKCTFGALKYSPTNGRVSVNQMQCWGCGVCRQGCPNDAITLIPREDIPQLKDIW